MHWYKIQQVEQTPDLCWQALSEPQEIYNGSQSPRCSNIEFCIFFQKLDEIEKKVLVRGRHRVVPVFQGELIVYLPFRVCTTKLST